MDIRSEHLHDWDITTREAVALQKELREKVLLRPFKASSIRTIAGVDVSVKDGFSRAAVSVLSFPDMQLIENVTFKTKTLFPYVPGLLSFREGPVILECMKVLATEVDLFVFDGQGLAHPRGLGLASHLGVILGKPSIGAAKTRLYGTYDNPGGKKGAFSPLKDDTGREIGAALTTRDNTRPMFISPGHMCDVKSAINIILACCPKYRIPEPIRHAHATAYIK
ncbi:MAG: endonuclease V [Candidatus Omnitrophica bacterium]|nr:endonuclease V [Candidatus Omnitrophota bacterium]